MKKQVGKVSSVSPEHGNLGSPESYKQFNRTFMMSKGDATESFDTTSKVSLALPGRSFVAEPRRRPSTNEKVLQTKLDSIKTIEFNIYQEVFNDTLGQMTTYRQVLEEVKQGYDSRINSLEEANSIQREQIEELQRTLEQERNDTGVMQRKLKKLAQENYQLSV